MKKRNEAKEAAESFKLVRENVEKYKKIKGSLTVNPKTGKAEYIDPDGIKKYEQG
jgi:stalled ribosome alternative rescue factor ArfA